MRNFYLLLFLLLAFAPMRQQAQCTIQIPADVFVLTNDTLMDISVGGGIMKPLLICNDVEVEFVGFSTWVIDVYMEEGSYFEISDTFSFYVLLDCYMRDGATLDYNRKMGSFFDTLIHDDGAVLIDTGSMVSYVHSCSNLVFDYSLLPGGASPCAGGSSRISTSENLPFRLVHHPESGMISLESQQGESNAQLQIFDLNGRLLMNTLIKSHEQLSVNHLASGIYNYLLSDQKGQRSSGKFVQR